MTFHKGGQQITSLEQWRALAPPKSDHQWVEGRSAMEVARAWLGSGENELPAEVIELLRTHPHFGDPTQWSAEPEARLPFDKFAGEPRNSDLAVITEDRFGTFVIGVEAKADEPFGETVSDTLGQALERKLANPRSNGLLRVEQLATAMLGERKSGTPSVGHLRYQLLTAAAGVLCEAERRGCDRALLLVHEFVTSKTDDDKHRRNAADLDAFVARLEGRTQRSEAAGQIHGPFSVPGSPLLTSPVRLYIAKVTRNLRSKVD